MPRITRRHFLTTSGIFLAGSLLVRNSFGQSPEKRLAFSTLGCPDWSFEKIIDFAQRHGYAGIEVRGLQRQLDLPMCPEFSSPENILKTRQMMKDRNLQFAGLGSSATLHFEAGPEREKHLDDGRRFIDLAAKLDCPYVRVFPNNFPKDQSKEAVINRIVRGLQQLGDHARQSDITVLMETHGDVVWVDDIETIMTHTSHEQVGLVWDIANMWTITKEPVAEAWQRLKPYIRHTHLKDAVKLGGKLQYRLLGRGEVPVGEAIELLHNNGYDGYYSFEWEKMWHPEIEEPEIAFADFPKVMKKYFAGKKQ